MCGSMRRVAVAASVWVGLTAAWPAGQGQSPPPASVAAPGARVFDFGPGPVAPGAQPVLAATTYNHERGFGFLETTGVTCLDRGAPDAERRDFCTSDAPFRFVVDLPEGNYRVTLTLGDAEGESLTTVRAESRRLMLERVATARGAFVTRSFTVNIRSPRLASGGSVALKTREVGTAHWDDALTLEFGDRRPAVTSVAIAPAPGATTVFLAGDSTVTDQTAEPYSSWGQMLPRFLAADVAVANHAESGESLRSFVSERRLEKIFETLKAGDYLFLQFAHNDQKLGLDTSAYEAQLQSVVADTRARRAVPVLVTSMERRRFSSAGTIVDSLAGFPEAMRRVARQDGVALIDLTAMSRRFYEALGPDLSARAFVHYPAGSFPGQTTELKDDTHFNAYGAYELARAVVEGIRTAGLGLASRLAADVLPFDPSHPDPPAAFSLPASPSARAGGDVAPAARKQPDTPTLFLVGDSTVQNATAGQLGWGTAIAHYFDASAIRVVNRALGGRSSRTFQTEGLWDQALKEMRRGDFVLIQFGHNDVGSLNTGRARGSLPGVGDDTKDVRMEATGLTETVRTFGWYLRKYVADARARGAIPVLCSLVPRNNWTAGRINRATSDYAAWARTVAESMSVPFLDLNDLVARRYEALGEDRVTRDLFYGDRTHTSPGGAQLSALTVIEALRALPGRPFEPYFSTTFSGAAWSTTSREEWDDPAVLHINTLPAHATMLAFPTAEAAVRGSREASPWFRSLNGVWKFRYLVEPRREARRVRAHDIRRHFVVRHPGAGQLGTPGFRPTDLQQFAIPLRLRPEEPPRPAQRQPGRVVQDDILGAAGVGRATGPPALCRRGLGLLRVGQRTAGRLQRGQPHTGGVRHHDPSPGWGEHARRGGVPLERRLVPRRPGHVPAERDLPRRVPVEPGDPSHPGFRDPHDVRPDWEERHAERFGGRAECGRGRRGGVPLRAAPRFGRPGPRPNGVTTGPRGTGRRVPRVARPARARAQTLVRRDAVPLHRAADAHGRGRPGDRSRSLPRRVPHRRDPRRAPAGERPGDPGERREPARAQPGSRPLRRAVLDAAGHRVDEAAQHQRGPHLALPERPGVVRALRRVRHLRDGRGERREPRVRPGPGQPAGQRPGVAALARRSCRADGGTRQEPPVDHRVVSR